MLGSLDHSSRGGGGLSNEASDPSKLSGAAPARPNLDVGRCARMTAYISVFPWQQLLGCQEAFGRNQISTLSILQ